MDIPEAPCIREVGPKTPYYRRNMGLNSLMVVYVDPLDISQIRTESRGRAPVICR